MSDEETTAGVQLAERVSIRLLVVGVEVGTMLQAVFPLTAIVIVDSALGDCDRRQCFGSVT